MLCRDVLVVNPFEDYSFWWVFARVGNDGDATEGKRTGAKETTARERWAKNKIRWWK